MIATLDDFVTFWKSAEEKGFTSAFQEEMAKTREPKVHEVRECLRAAIDMGLHKKSPCPVLPLAGVEARRENYSPADFWLLCLECCYVHWFCGQTMRPAELKQMEPILFDLIEPRGNDYFTLRDTLRNLRGTF